jgi:RNA polymerase sigma-70 factor (ECF subfamily)
MDDKTDEELAALVQGNNDVAYGVLIERYQARLLRYGRKFLSNEDHIEDIVQDVFIKTYQNIRGFDAGRKFSPWIYRIAHNAFVNALRKKGREPVMSVDFDIFTDHPVYHYDPVEDEDRKAMHATVEAGLGALTPLYKEIIVLYYIEELSYQEISEILHIPLGTVSVRLRRGREALKKVIRAQENHE